MPNKIIGCFLYLAGVLVVPGSLDARSPPVSVDSKLYYQVGGARSITGAANPLSHLQSYGGSASLGFGYSCGKFDRSFGISKIFDSLKNLDDVLVDAVTGFISGIPLLILQRAAPGLYDLFQGFLIRSEAILQLATANCEAVERNVANGKGAFYGWGYRAKVGDWQSQMRVGGMDAETARQYVERSNGANGVPWACGVNAGGRGQKAIRTTYDIVVAGYNLTLGRGACDLSKPGVDPETTPLVRYWSTPEEAAKWAVEVAGDVSIRTHEDSAIESMPGFGLPPKIDQESTEIAEKLAQLVVSSEPPSLTLLNEVSSSETLITPDVIRTLRSLEPADQNVLISKLADEAAMNNVLERAITLHRLLMTGRREPHIASSEAPEYIDQTVADLKREVDNILFEKRARNELLAATSMRIIELGEERGILQSKYLNRANKPGQPIGNSSLSTQ